VDAGVLKRVLLADGAVVSVQGAREVSLSRPLQLPLLEVRKGAWLRAWWPWRLACDPRLVGRRSRCCR
jgi:hypothetical protein